jgi:hypothetical protein
MISVSETPKSQDIIGFWLFQNGKAYVSKIPWLETP